MRQAPPELRELARGLLEREAGVPPGAGVPAGVAVTAVRRLHDHLAHVVGSAGYDALLGRALSLARQEYPSLQGARVEPGGCLAIGPDAVCTPGEGEDAGAVLVLANVYWLLVTFIGEDLTARLVGEVWPAPPDAAMGGK